MAGVFRSAPLRPLRSTPLAGLDLDLHGQLGVGGGCGAGDSGDGGDLAPAVEPDGMDLHWRGTGGGQVFRPGTGSDHILTNYTYHYPLG